MNKFKKSENLHFSKGVKRRFWSKNGHFSIFFLGNIGQENVFYDIIERKNTFVGLKNNKFKKSKNWHFSKAGAHQMESPSPIQALGVNPFPSTFIIRAVPRGDLARRRWEEPITTTKWHCYCTSSNSRKFGVDAFSSLRDFLSFLSSRAFKLWLCYC